MRIITSYQNGNYTVDLFDDGTKVRRNNLDTLIPSFHESIDCKITDYCNIGCDFCYENSCPSGKHANLLGNPFFDTSHPFTEMAIGGGSPILHPDLIPFLEELKEKHLLPSMTVHQKHFVEKYEMIKELVDKHLIWGVGVSVSEPTQELIEKLKTIPNSVVHVIAGIFNSKVYDELANHQLKLLILGYKDMGRGKLSTKTESESLSIDTNLNWLKSKLKNHSFKKHFKAIGFDNLALTQLEVKQLFSQKVWEEMYMGNDGEFTFYVDLVSGQFSKNSVSTVQHNISDFNSDADLMFQKIRSEVNLVVDPILKI